MSENAADIVYAIGGLCALLTAASALWSITSDRWAATQSFFVLCGLTLLAAAILIVDGLVSRIG